MKFPAGTDRGIVTNPLDEDFIRELQTFRGACQIETEAGHGFIVIDNGSQVAAYYRAGEEVFLGCAALQYITIPPAEDREITELRLREYDEHEFSLALQIAKYEHLICNTGESLVPEKEGSSIPGKSPALLDERMLQKILTIPGVIAVSAFFEGFPVQSLGDADFEHVAVSAEDFMRSGTKIAREMGVGDLEQLILETATSKFIIAPCGDLYLCIFATSDAQLGLIRVVLTSILSEMSP
jgi:predicted regulator of Ras-like GTPase activity (Roadblock/LC7/MglB family)